jgi:hypothetical protein
VTFRFVEFCSRHGMHALVLKFHYTEAHVTSLLYL